MLLVAQPTCSKEWIAALWRAKAGEAETQRGGDGNDLNIKCLVNIHYLLCCTDFVYSRQICISWLDALWPQLRYMTFINIHRSAQGTKRKLRTFSHGQNLLRCIQTYWWRQTCSVSHCLCRITALSAPVSPQWLDSSENTVKELRKLMTSRIYGQ